MPFQELHATHRVFHPLASQHLPRSKLRLTLDTHPWHRQTYHRGQPSQPDAQRKRNLNPIHIRQDDALKLRSMINAP